MTITGGCLCGAIRYAITGSLGQADNCHCSMCRKAHGAAFSSYALVAPQAWRWTAGAELCARYRSSPGYERVFCPRCGSPLAVLHEGEIMGVTLGTVDGDPGVRPAFHMFVASKAPWFEITDELPCYPAYPPGFGPGG